MGSSHLVALNAKSFKQRHTKRSRGCQKSFNALTKVLSQNTNQFCENTTLHGLKYLADKELYPLEKFYFGIAFATVVILSFYFAARVIDKWTTTPVILGINPKPTKIADEPFPAVTICNLNVAYKSKAEQYSVFSTEYAMLQMLCKKEVNVSIASTITDWSGLNKFIAEIAQPCENMLLSCRYGAITYNCSELFRSTITDEGLCCSFNMVHPNFMYSSYSPIEDNATDLAGFFPVHWTSEGGYQKDIPPKYYPREAVGVGETLGLTTILNVEADKYYCSSANSVGFKLLLHSPNELPSLREIGLLLAAGLETKIRIRTFEVESQMKLRSIDKRYRNCLFSNEMRLRYFTHYTQRNCELECVARSLKHYCDCVSHYMPLYYGNETICSIYESTCVERARVIALSNKHNNRSCDQKCLPSCYDVSYTPDFFSTPLSHNGFKIKDQLIDNMRTKYVERNIAVVHFYFDENSFRSTKQTEFFGVTDVLSNIGGLIGVFFGFSFISVVEFIFFAIIRPFRAAIQRIRSKESIFHDTKFTKKQMKSSRKHYRRELGFDDKKTIDEDQLNIEKYYMSGEFYKKNSGMERWAERSSDIK